MSPSLYLLPSAISELVPLVQGVGPLGKSGSPHALGGGVCTGLKGIGDGGREWAPMIPFSVGDTDDLDKYTSYDLGGSQSSWVLSIQQPTLEWESSGG